MVNSSSNTPTLKEMEALQDSFFFYLKNEQDLSEDSIRSYIGSLKVFFSWFKERGEPEFTSYLMGQYLASLKQKGLSAGTRKLYISSLRRFFAFLIREDILSFDPLYDVKVKKDPAGHSRDDISIAQVKLLLKTIMDAPAKTERTNLAKLRDYAIIYLMLKTGIREIEVQRANIGDIRTLKGYHILDIQGKGRKEKKDLVVLRPEVHKAIMNYLSMRPTSEKRLSSPLFSRSRKSKNGGRLTTRSVRGRISCYLKLAGIKTPRITAHSLRHTFANVALSRTGEDARKVQRSLRHKNVATTEIYLHDKKRIEGAAELEINDY